MTSELHGFTEAQGTGEFLQPRSVAALPYHYIVQIGELLAQLGQNS